VGALGVQPQRPRDAAATHVTVTVSLKLGTDLQEVGSDTVSVSIAARSVALAPVSTNVAANAGTLRSADGTHTPCETADPSATYHAGLAAGTDRIQVTMHLLLDGGERRTLGTATAQATVAPDMIEGHLLAEAIHDFEHPRCAGPVYVQFAKRPGVTSYLVHGYNYNDATGYYGSDYRHYGPPFDARDTQTESTYHIFLTGMTTS
jgi:hypothetical protein